jgi:hypothetical protein
MQLFLDCDGVLANFDKRAIEIFGMHPRDFEDRYGPGTFWKRIKDSGEFFYQLEMMEDAHLLYEGTKQYKPIILTGVPQVANKWAPDQKKRWVARMFGEHQPVITCRSRNKRDHGKPGDILIDDYTKYRHLWLEMGGRFILHSSATQSLYDLEEMLANEKN